MVSPSCPQCYRALKLTQDSKRLGMLHTDEEAQDVHLRGRGAFAHDDREDGPDGLAGRDPDAGTNFGEKHVAGDFAEDVAHCPARRHDVELVPVEPHVLLHPGDVGIGDIFLWWASVSASPDIPVGVFFGWYTSNSPGQCS